MIKLLIRRASLSDIDTVAQLIFNMMVEINYMESVTLSEPDQAQLELRKGLESKIPDVTNFRYLLARADESENDCAVAEASIRSYGALFNRKRVLHIHSLYVLPHYRSRGIAGRMLDELLVWGRESQCESVELGVIPSNPARRLYEKLGVEVSKLIMSKDIRD